MCHGLLPFLLVVLLVIFLSSSVPVIVALARRSYLRIFLMIHHVRPFEMHHDGLLFLSRFTMYDRLRCIMMVCYFCHASPCTTV